MPDAPQPTTAPWSGPVAKLDRHLAASTRGLNDPGALSTRLRDAGAYVSSYLNHACCVVGAGLRNRRRAAAPHCLMVAELPLPSCVIVAVRPCRNCLMPTASIRVFGCFKANSPQARFETMWRRYSVQAIIFSSSTRLTVRLRGPILDLKPMHNCERYGSRLPRNDLPGNSQK